ncbi:hypothetical protein AB4076_10890 [Dyella sp. 2RAF44]|uniref:hypothetical protein n=1 Tax=Dyella sp. 2RAF44 TaxID=3233000 RepID=UPI003F92854D
MARTKQIKAAIILGGSVASSLKTAFGSTEGGLKRIGDQVLALTKRQKTLGSAIQTFGKMGKNVDGLRASYAAVTTQVARLQAQQARLNAAQSKYNTLSKAAGAARGFAGKMALGAAAVGAPVMMGVSEASRYQTEQSRVRSLGLGDKVSSEAFGFAKQMKTYGTSQLDNLTLVRDALSVFGDMHHAQMAAPILAKMKFGNEAMYGGEHGGENEEKFLNMLKVIELRGGTKSEADFKKQANMVQKVISATGGRVGPDEWRNLIATGGLAAKGMRDDAFFYQLEPLVQEMGGDRVGTGLSAAYTALYQGRTTKRAANNLAKYGLIADQSKVKHDKAGQVSFLDPGALKGAELFRTSQYEWMKQVLLPTLAAKGVTSKDQVLDAIGSMFSNKKGGDLMAAMYLQQQQIDKNEQLNRGAYDIDQLNDEGQRNADGKKVKAQKAFDDAKLRMGQAVLPMYTKALELASGALESLNNFAEKNPKLFGAMATGVAALAAGMAVLAPIAITVGGALSAYAGYSLVMAKFGGAAMTTFRILGGGLRLAMVAFRAVGAALLTNPVFWIGAALAGLVFEIYKHWDGVKAFFGKLWEDLKTIFHGATEFVAGLFTGDWGRMVAGLKEYFSGLGTFVSDIFGGIADGIKTVVNDILSAVGLAQKKDDELKKKQAPIEWITGAEGEKTRRPPSPIKWITGAEANIPQPPAPSIPPMATARGTTGATAAPVTQNNTFNITQQPGESSEQLARRTADLMNKQQGVASRGALYDGTH